MFEKLRKPKLAKNIAYYIIFGLICLVFVFIGVPVSQMSNMGGVALRVNNEVISWSEYRRYLETLEQNQSQMDTGLDARRQEQLKGQAVETLLSMELMAQSARKFGFVISAKEIQDRVADISFLQEEGQFMHSKYRAFLTANRFSAGYFENLIRKEIQTARFQNIFSFAVQSSSAGKEKKRKLRAFQLQVSYIQFSSMGMDASEFNSIEAFLQEGDLELLNSLVKNKNWKWEKTGKFNLNRVSLPGFEDQKVLFDEVLVHLPSTGIVKKIINTRDKSFILRVDSFTLQKEDSMEESAFPFSRDFFGDRMVSRMVFLSWMRSSRSSAKIKLNPKLVSLE